MTRLMVCVVVLLVVSSAGAVERYWTGASSTSWNTAGNWTPSGAPGTGDIAIFDGNTSVVNCALNENVDVAGILIKASYSGTITQLDAHTLQVRSASDWIQLGGTFKGGTGGTDVEQQQVAVDYR